MKIKKEDLEKIIKECVDAKIEELEESMQPDSSKQINWHMMKYLHAKGKLHGKWHIIMTAFLEAGENDEKALAMLKAAVATLEAKKSSNDKPEEEMASLEDLTDFSKF